MFIDFIKSLNWVDILILGLAVRIIYIGIQTGIMTEFIKALGLVVALFLSFQCFVAIGDIIKMGGKIPEGFFLAIGFLIIWALVALMFSLIRQGIFLLFTVQTISAVDKWGGAVLAVGRFILTASMVMFIFLLTGNEYLQTKTADAFSRPSFVNVAPRFYKSLSEKFVSKILPGVKYNSAVRETLKAIE